MRTHRVAGRGSTQTKLERMNLTRSVHLERTKRAEWSLCARRACRDFAPLPG